jgi:hypothetical protein
MKNRACLVVLFFCFYSVSISAQTSYSSGRTNDPVGNSSADLAKISRSVQTLTEIMQKFVDKFEKVSGLTLTEKQQKLILGMEMLTRMEARVQSLQKSQIELTEKLNSVRSKLAQIEIDLRPRNINNSTTYAATTETEELRENTRQKLERERTSLSQLENQINNNLAETGAVLREAQMTAERLRRMFLPQIERELYDQ